MPLTRSVFDTSEEPCNISALLRQVLDVVKGLDTKVDVMDAKMSVIETKVNAICGKVNWVDNKMFVMKVNVDTSAVKIKGIDTKVDAMAFKIKAIDAKVNAVSSDHETLKEQLKVVFEHISTTERSLRKIKSHWKRLEMDSSVYWCKVKAEHKRKYGGKECLEPKETSCRGAERPVGPEAEQGPPRKVAKLLTASTDQAREDNREPDATEATQGSAAAVSVKADVHQTTGCMIAGCVRFHKPEINKMVQEYLVHKRWETLKSNLQTVVDHSSEVYKQLCAAVSVSDVGCSGFIHLASLLLCSGMPVNTGDGVNTGTMLHGAANIGYMQLAKHLLDRGAFVNARDDNGYTPLMVAVMWDRLEMVQLLVQAGADTATTGNSKDTALDMARRLRKTAVAEYLQQLPH